MTQYTVTIIRHITTYLTATTTVEASSVEEAAAIASKRNLEWTDDDTVNEGPVDYEVSSEDGPTESWRDDG